MAAQENHENVVRYLLSHGANQSLATEVCPNGIFFFCIIMDACDSSKSKRYSVYGSFHTHSWFWIFACRMGLHLWLCPATGPRPSCGHSVGKRHSRKGAIASLAHRGQERWHQSGHSASPKRAQSRCDFQERIHSAAYRRSLRQWNVAQLLLEKGANVNYQVGFRFYSICLHRFHDFHCHGIFLQRFQMPISSSCGFYLHTYFKFWFIDTNLANWFIDFKFFLTWNEICGISG